MRKGKALTLNQFIKQLQKLQEQGHGRKPVVQHGPRQSCPHQVGWLGVVEHELYRTGTGKRNCVEIFTDDDI